jgi:hypothetical protein
MEALLFRHDWLSHWLSVINFIFNPFSLPTDLRGGVITFQSSNCALVNSFAYKRTITNLEIPRIYFRKLGQRPKLHSQYHTYLLAFLLPSLLCKVYWNCKWSNPLRNICQSILICWEPSNYSSFYWD